MGRESRRAALVYVWRYISKLLAHMWKVLQDTLPLQARILGEKKKIEKGTKAPWSSEWLDRHFR